MKWSLYSISKSPAKKILPKKVWRLLMHCKSTFLYWLSKFYFPYYLFVQWRYDKTAEKIRKKDKITAVFFLIHESIWKYGGVYKLMEQDKRFEPIVVVCPNIWYGEEYMLREMDRAYSSFLTRGYNVIKALNETTQQWLDVKKEIKPDIVFFTYPGKMTKSEYYVYNFLDCLTVYVPYGFMAANIQRDQYDLVFHNLIWRCYYETTIHKEMAKKYATNKGVNVVITGFPMCDVFWDSAYTPKDVWKVKDKNVKRIIWAPHHTLENNKKQYAYSNFLTDYQFMLDIAKQFEGRIQIAFKPHPVLKPTLYSHPGWGKERTDAYYKTWLTIENGQLEEGDYIDLFLTSDAMILDSISFISEYCYTGKPSLFLIRDDTIINKFNEYGRMTFDLVYKASNHNDILDFINITVLNKNDPLSKERQAFIDKYLTPPNNQTATENIYCDLAKETKL